LHIVDGLSVGTEGDGGLHVEDRSDDLVVSHQTLDQKTVLDSIVENVDGNRDCGLVPVETKVSKEVFQSSVFYFFEVLMDSRVGVVGFEAFVDVIDGDHFFDCGAQFVQSAAVA
jgi:hypothetical protein